FSRDWSSDVCSSDLDRQLLQFTVYPLGLRGIADIDDIDKLLLKLSIRKGQGDKNACIRLGGSPGIEFQVISCAKDDEITACIGRTIKKLIVVKCGIQHLKIVEVSGHV